MKFVFIVAIVCAIALNLSFDFVNSQTHPQISVRNGTPVEEQVEVAKIVNAWVKCHPKFSGPFDNEIYLFPHWTVQNADISAKCLADCTLRETGVMTDYGLHYSDIFIEIQLVKDNKMRFSKNCFPISAEILRNMDLNRSQFNHYICYQVIWSIDQDADDCRRLKDPEGNNCETTWKIMQCMTKEHNGRLINGTFIPIELVDLKLLQ